MATQSQRPVGNSVVMRPSKKKKSTLRTTCRASQFGEGHGSAERPQSVWGGATSLAEVMANASRLWGNVVDIEPRQAADGPADERFETAPEVDFASGATARRSKIAWAETVDATEREKSARPRTVAFSDTTAMVARSATVPRTAIDDARGRFGVFVMVVKSQSGAGKKYPALLHTIGMTSHGLPELYVRCPNRDLGPITKAVNMVAGGLIRNCSGLVIGAPMSTGDTLVPDELFPGVPPNSDGTARRHFEVRVLEGEELNLANNRLVLQAADYYKHAVAVIELVPLPMTTSLPATGRGCENDAPKTAATQITAAGKASPCGLCLCPSNTKFCNRCSRVGGGKRRCDMYKAYRAIARALHKHDFVTPPMSSGLSVA